MEVVLLYAVIFAVMYAVFVVPKQRQQKKQAAMLAALEEGDEILLSSGIYGFVSAIDESVLWVEIAEDVELKVDRASVAGRVMPPGEESIKEEKDEEDEG